MTKKLPTDMAGDGAPREPTGFADPSPSEEHARKRATLRSVTAGSLRANRLQPPLRHADEEVGPLAASIEAIGLLCPPLVRRCPDNTYVIIAGHRRVRAWQLLALDGRVDPKIRAYVISDMTDAEEIYAIAAEYTQRQAYSPLHTARVIGAAHAERTAEIGRTPTQRDLEDVLPWKKSVIGMYLRVYAGLEDPELGPLVQQSDKASLRLLHAILKHPDRDMQREALERCHAEGEAAARKVIRPADTRPDAASADAVSRATVGDGFELTVRIKPTMSADDAAAAEAALQKALVDLQAMSS